MLVSQENTYNPVEHYIAAQVFFSQVTAAVIKY